MDTFIFKYGFNVNNMRYGWYKNKLYRLPSNIKLRNYSFKELKEILIGNKIGYRLMKKKFTVEQLGLITNPIVEVKIGNYSNNDLPF